MVLYEEHQYFRVWWMSVVNALVLLTTGYTLYRLWDQGVEWIHFLAPAVGLLVVLGLALVPLRTRITPDRIEVGFYPFQKRIIPREAIATAGVRQYAPLAEFGGWGYRAGSRGRAFTTMGDRGLQLELTDGRRVLIGTQRPGELERVLDGWR